MPRKHPSAAQRHQRKEQAALRRARRRADAALRQVEPLYLLRHGDGLPATPPLCPCHGVPMELQGLVDEHGRISWL